jgi:hypothetical protein
MSRVVLSSPVTNQIRMRPSRRSSGQWIGPVFRPAWIGWPMVSEMCTR